MALLLQSPLGHKNIKRFFSESRNKKPAAIAPTIAAGLDRTIEQKPEGAGRDWKNPDHDALGKCAT
ncbi:hypothetical protein [Pseudomonas serboccidentalis]|uniref:hypothetical protein n=1 Tax=Pseudomonas serboccidentalis TaxID=2964670 RepID=UPI0039DFE64F